jgi:FkbM family methyltransferase
MEITIHGRRFQVTETHKAFWESVEAGKWEPYTFDILDKYVPRHDNYLDIGAWIGPTAIYAAPLCERSIAVEPDPVAYEQLCENIVESRFVFQTRQCAISDYDGLMVLGAEELGNSMTRLSAAHPGREVIEVWCESLKTLVTKDKITGSMFIKMDVEGAEELILRDIEFFKKHKPTLYLSLHPMWFRNSTTAAETIDRIGSLYRYHIHPAAGDTNTVLFTDLDETLDKA